MAFDALTVGIIIIVGCVIFLAVSWFLIIRNAKDEKRKLKAREKLQLGKRSRRHVGVPLAVDVVDERAKSSKVTFKEPTPEPPAPKTPTPDPPPRTPTPEPAAPVVEAAAVATTDLGAKGEPGEPDSGLDTDVNGPDPAALAAGAVVGAGIAAAVTSEKPSEVTPDDVTPDDDEPPDDVEPPPAVIVASEVGVTATVVGAQEVQEKRKKKKKLIPKKPQMEIAPAPVSDFDDYRAMAPRNLPPPMDHGSSPPPAVYEPPTPAERSSKVREVKARRAAKVTVRDNEGTDF